ncbi:MAG: hypothetical protein AAB508_06550 [Patescibacteria group bacterium]
MSTDELPSHFQETVGQGEQQLNAQRMMLAHLLISSMPPENTFKERQLRLKDIAFGVAQPNPGYGVESIFGGTFEEDIQDAHLIRDALKSVFFDEIVSKEVWATGSAITLPHEASSAKIRGKSLAEALSPFLGYGDGKEDLTIFERINVGQETVQKLSAGSYAMYSLLKDSRGPNLDIHMIDARGNKPETLRLVHAILRFSVSYPFDGPRRSLSIVRHPNGFSYIHLEIGGAGMNVIIEDPGEWNAWEKQSSLRQFAQKGKLMIEQDGTIVVHAMDKNVRSEKITLDESPDSLGDWQQYVARTIRSMVFHDLNTDLLDLESIKRVLPDGDQIDFTSAIGVMTNLTAAFYRNPKKTMNLLKLTGFEKYLPFFSEENARKIFGAKNPKLVVQPEFNFSDEYTDLVNFLGASDQELFPKPWTKSEFNMHYHEFFKARDAAKWYALFSPISASQFIRVTPDSSHRETIEGYRAGGNWKDLSMISGAVSAFRALYWEAKNIYKERQAMIIDLAITHMQRRFFRTEKIYQI